MTPHQILDARLRLRRSGPPCAVYLLFLLASASAVSAGVSSARGYLEEAAATSHHIALSGDQSAARREVAIVLTALDTSAALQITAGISRPSDAARALARIAVALSGKDPPEAKETAGTAARLLLRIADLQQRLAEQRLFLGEIAPMGAEAVPNAPELKLEEARPIVIAALARTQPEEALALATTWELAGASADAALAILAPRLAVSHRDKAVELAARISDVSLRDRTLWQVAELQSPAEAASVVPWIEDPITRDNLLASATVRMGQVDPEAASAAVAAISVCPVSVRAEMAVEAASRDATRGAALAQQLPPIARDWAMGRIALELASAQPERAEAYLQEISENRETVRLVAARMAAKDAPRAIRLARSMLAGEERDAALAAIVPVLAPRDVALARDLIAEIGATQWRAQAVGSVALQLAQHDGDAATSLLGLIADPNDLMPIRAKVAAAVAARDPELALHLLATTPKTGYRTACAHAAALAVLGSAGSLETATQLATAGMESDLASRWLLPAVVLSGAGSGSTFAERMEQPYLRVLALVDTARALIGGASAAQPAPDRARMIRPIVEWDSR